MKKICFFLVLIFLGFSCNRGQKNDSFTIRGQFQHAGNEKIVICEMDVREIIPVDSAVPDNEGNVSFSHPLDQPGFYLLIFPDGKRITLVMQAGEDLILKGDLRNPDGEFTLTGSVGSELLEGFFRATMKNKARIDSVKRVLLREEGTDEFLRSGLKADSLFFRINEDQKKLEKEFIDRNPESLASLIVLNYSFGPKPVLTMEDDLAWYQKLTGLYRIYPKNKHVLFHMKRMSLFMNNLKNTGN
ncbi:MAG: DUF4369 domain-containing protein [Bacteroidetes bacterium]|nr:DUF4369 domain-containing protein [Bacteroidota bacterium]